MKTGLSQTKIFEFHSPKYFFEGIYYQFKENCTHELFCLCTRAFGNLAMKRLRIHFIKAKVYFLEIERKEEAIFFEENRGTQEIAKFYDVVQSPPSKTSATVSEVIQGAATKTTQTTLNSI